MISLDEKIRLAGFNWLRQQTDIHGDVLPRELLAEGFIFENERVPLVSPQGIFKPKIMELPLTITTTPKSRYEDALRDDGFLNYKYRGEDINYWDNVGLRECMKRKTPLVYLLGIVPGKYLPVWPVYIVGDDPGNLTFIVEADMLENQVRDGDKVYEKDITKLYSTTTVKVRIHQKAFREKVLYAYRTQCTFCRLKHSELLDAAHILPDDEVESKPTVDNGLALCKLHHAAFDKYFIGITPDYQIVVRKEVLDEEDGPMLQHGLKGLHNTKLYLPKHKIDYPNKNLLDIKYQRFKNAS